mgnify:FL=1
MTTIKDIVDDVIQREGGAAVTNDPTDRGGRTQYGISEKSHPDAWADGRVTEEEARAIYEKKYVIYPGFDKVQDDRLRAHLVDFGVNSGPQVAVSKLQEILGVVVDGVLGVRTLEALNARRADDLNNRLVASRVRMIGRIVSKVPSQLKWLNGWLDRSLSFME